MKWTSESRVLCDSIHIKLKERFYNIAIRPTTKSQDIKKKYVHKMSVPQMRILRLIHGNTCTNKIWNEEICIKIKVTPTDKKMKMI